MKEIQGLKIGWTHFQVKELTAAESKSWASHWVNRFNYGRDIYVDIHDAYKKPSEAKVSIWNAWISWARDVNMFSGTYEVENLSICARTNQMFTVCAIIREFDDDEIYRKLCGNYLTVATYIMVATKYHNYLYKLASDESVDDIDLCW